MNALFDPAISLHVVLTLGHFLWQGLVIGTAAWLVALALPRKPAAWRYRVYLAALLVMATCPMVTFLWLGRAAMPAVAERSLVAAAESSLPKRHEATRAATSDTSDTVDAVAPGLDTLAIGGELRDANEAADSPVSTSMMLPGMDGRRFAHFLTAVYFAGVLLMLVRLAWGLRGGRQLRRRSQPVSDPELLELLAHRAGTLGMRSVPTLAWCREVAVPTVVGVVRPAILLPVSLTTGLTSDQLAAILTHELAHIRRWDPLVNVFQRIVEAVLFFHPMVWFISRRIRQERENCCDDLVLATGTDPVGYAASLLDIAERATEKRQQARTALATLQAAGGTSELGGRIQRLLGGGHREPIRLNRPGLALAVVMGLLALAALSRLAVNAEDESRLAKPVQYTATDAGTSRTDRKNDRRPEGMQLEPITGVATGRSGRPVAGAKVFLREYTWGTRANQYPGGTRANRDPAPTRTLTSVTTGPDGRFVFENVPLPEETHRAGPRFPYPLVVIVVADGYAVSWKPVRTHPNRPLAFSLRPPGRLFGRVIDADGEPLADVGLRILRILPLTELVSLDQRGVAPRFIGSGSLDMAWPESPLQARSGPDGAFHFDGVPRNSGIVLEIDDRRYLPTRGYACANPEHPLIGQATGTVLQTGRIELPAERGVHLRVRVVDAETGRAIAGAQLPMPPTVFLPPTVFPPSEQTNAEGVYDYYRLGPGEQIRLSVYPPIMSDYLPTFERIELPAETFHMEHVVQLAEGHPVTGHVVNKETGAPLSGRCLA